MNRIDAYLDALRAAFGAAGNIVPWPLHLGEVLPYCGDLEALELVARLEDLSASGWSDAEIGRLFVGASSPKSLLGDLVISMKVAEVPVDKRVWVVERWFDVMAAKESGDIFCRDGTHRVLSPGDAQALADSLPWVTGTAFAQQAFRLSGAAQAHVWALLFYGWTDIGFEIHGPYDVSFDGRPSQLVVRDFFDLKPVLLWPELADFACSRMRVISVHPPDAGMAVDIFNHLTHPESLLTSTDAIFVDVDDVPLSEPGALRDVGKLLLAQVRRQHEAIEAMTRPDLVTKFVAARYYAFRHWRLSFDVPWEPPQEVATRISTWDPIVIEPDDASTQNVTHLLAAFDPRTESLP